MNAFEQWALSITGELRGAGFTVTEHQGFPLVPRPESMADGVRFLEWTSPSGLPCVKNIYAEGCLITPEMIKRR